MSLRVLELFGHASWQTSPQNGRRRFGVPPGGAFDQESYALANALIGNKQGTPTIELAMGHLKLECRHATRVAVVGAQCPMSIDGRAAPCQSAFSLLSGQTLEMNAPTLGARVYIALPLDHDCKTSALQRGADIDCSPESKPNRVRTVDQPSTISSNRIHVFAFAQQEIPNEPLRVCIRSDRVGIRLEGATMKPGEERLSEPACVGAIQATNDGGLIILGPDGPTIGGYKKVGVVCSADLSKLAQLQPGQEIMLAEVGRNEATRAWQEQNQEIEARLLHLASIPAT